MTKKYSYSKCSVCNEKKPTTSSVYCRKCSDKRYINKPLCKCGKTKEILHHAYCNDCKKNSYKKRRDNRFDFKNDKIWNTGVVQEFIKKIIKRDGYCSVEEIFELIDIWHILNENNIHKYDYLKSYEQVKKMWVDIKNYFYMMIEKSKKNTY